MSSSLTRVSLMSIPRRLNVYLRFGEPFKVIPHDNRRRDAYFAPRQLFCRVWWQGNRYGTTRWQLDILQAKQPGDLLQALHGIAPGAASLLSVRGERNVKAVMRLIGVIEGQGLAPTDASAAYWRVVHNRLAAGKPATEYGPDRQAAETLRCNLG